MNKDPRYSKLMRYQRRLFPERICPIHDKFGTAAASSKPSKLVWCIGENDGRSGHWFVAGVSDGDST